MGKQASRNDVHNCRLDIVKAFLDQIAKHNKNGAHLNCVNSVVPKRIVLDTAAKLDRERLEGRLRSPYHGIPFLVKVRMACSGQQSSACENSA